MLVDPFERSRLTESTLWILSVIGIREAALPAPPLTPWPMIVSEDTVFGGLVLVRTPWALVTLRRATGTLRELVRPAHDAGEKETVPLLDYALDCNGAERVLGSLLPHFIHNIHERTFVRTRAKILTEWEGHENPGVAEVWFEEQPSEGVIAIPANGVAGVVHLATGRLVELFIKDFPFRRSLPPRVPRDKALAEARAAFPHEYLAEARLRAEWLSMKVTLGGAIHRMIYNFLFEPTGYPPQVQPMLVDVRVDADTGDVVPQF